VELNKTRCLDCGHLNRWHSYKWASTPERREHNRKNNNECPKCGSENVQNVEDDETMEMANFAAGVISQLFTEEPPVPPEQEVAPDPRRGKVDRAVAALQRRRPDVAVHEGSLARDIIESVIEALSDEEGGQSGT
jgi:Zn finger protein HypA/HybF involved in hydrogenase expression